MSSKKRILVIEDAKDVASLIEKRLEREGYIIDLAVDGKSGLEKAKKTKPDLIVLDLILPVVDGYKICEDLKTDDEYKNIRIIMLTCRDSKIEENAGYASGADDYLRKPYQPEELLGKIKKLLEC